MRSNMVPNHVPNKMKHTEFCVLHKQGCRQCSLKLPQIERPMFDLDRNYAAPLRFLFYKCFTTC